ncbi:hypothetical protein FOPG_16366 [Fusarium oxysporum f. sp. conglutinans race 2 54008]|uniref:Uncharacterized protein n=1 Tax=Fusarium oxysporum f. sp. conglutinans race 2 54008 TaxID=1089457 RepID=X0H6D8_FUSOX|nr:hypothetical protein FOPG_16366 [Fusarium oxysporum f. sp. conglutinans race 2 54008]
MILGISDFYGLYTKDIALALLISRKSFFDHIDHIVAFY